MAGERNSGEGGKTEGKQKEGRVLQGLEQQRCATCGSVGPRLTSVSHSISLLDRWRLRLLILRSLCRERMKHSGHVTCTQTATPYTVMCFSLVPTKRKKTDKS